VVSLVSNRKVVRQFASNPKGREHNHHGRWRLQRTKGTVRISDGLLISERFQRLRPAHDSGACSQRFRRQRTRRLSALHRWGLHRAAQRLLLSISSVFQRTAFTGLPRATAFNPKLLSEVETVLVESTLTCANARGHAQTWAALLCRSVMH